MKLFKYLLPIFFGIGLLISCCSESADTFSDSMILPNGKILEKEKL